MYQRERPSRSYALSYGGSTRWSLLFIGTHGEALYPKSGSCTWILSSLSPSAIITVNTTTRGASDYLSDCITKGLSTMPTGPRSCDDPVSSASIETNSDNIV